MINWTIELPLIQAEASKWGLDFAFLQAIRACENGAHDGDAFGVLSVSAPTYADQLRITAETVTHRLATYTLNPLTRDPFNRVRYKETWIAYFSAIWAPSGASNDPNEENAHWYSNACYFYKKFRDE